MIHIFFIFVICANSLSFDKYRLLFDKKYEKSEFTFRNEIFNTNLQKIISHNANSSSNWRMQINQFTDRTESELHDSLTLEKNLKRNLRTNPLQKSKLNRIDWRDKHAITPIKNQGACGGCWAFSAVETIESYFAIKYGKLIELSIQQILDCVWDYNSKRYQIGGCLGGTVELAYETVTKMHGITSNSIYPYKSYNGNDNYACNRNLSANSIAKVSKFETLPENNYDAVINYVSNYGPLTISVDASSWFGYSSGVFDSCGKIRGLNHAVQLVGFGTDSSRGDYWLVRNSWGGSWGENGYIRLRRRNASCNDIICGECGILYHSTYPIIG